jgi:putative endonuclease
MAHFVYVIGTKQKNRLITYVGYTNDIKKRLNLHNKSRGAKFTRGRHWVLIYSEKYLTKKEALSREYYIKKNRKVRNLIKKNFNE